MTKTIFWVLLVPVLFVTGCVGWRVVEKNENYTAFEYAHNTGLRSGKCSWCGAYASGSSCVRCGRKFTNPYRSWVERRAEIHTDDATLIRKLAQESNLWYVRIAAVEKLTNQEVLAEIVKKDSNHRVQEAAIEKLTNQEVLAEIAKNNSNALIRTAAVEAITNQEVLAEIAKTYSEFAIRITAVRILSNQEVLTEISKEVLAEIAKEDSDPMIRKYAARRLKELRSRRK